MSNDPPPQATTSFAHRTWNLFFRRPPPLPHSGAPEPRRDFENRQDANAEQQGADADRRPDAGMVPIISENDAQQTTPDGRRPIRQQTELEIVREGPDDAEPSSARAPSQPVCLICLENLAPDDFASGRAISLGCKCRGDVALRHRDCAEKWARVKDDGRGGVPICELCKQPARNLKALPPRLRPQLPPGADSETAVAVGLSEGMYDQYSYATFAPSTADLAFDCIRVTWVAMIVSILFFEASLGSALWTGLVAGVAYCFMVRAMYRQHFEAMRAYAEDRASAAAGRETEGGAQVPPGIV